MTMNETTTIRVRSLDDLMIKYYRAFRSVALIDARGEVLAQLEAKPDELGPHLQFRLLQAALEHRWVTEQWQMTGLAIRHGDTLTVAVDGELKDYEAPQAEMENLRLIGDSLHSDHDPLKQRTVNVQDLFEAVTS